MTAAKTSHSKQGRVLSNFIVITRTRQMQANSPGVNFLRTTSKFRERKKCNVIRIISVRPPENVKIRTQALLAENVQKIEMHEQSCWFVNQTYCISDVLAAVAIVICYTPY